MDKAAAAKFATILGEHESLGSGRGHLSTMAILMADNPSAYGSAAAPRPSQNASPGAPVVIPNTVKWMREIKTCRGCSTAVYCNEALLTLHRDVGRNTKKTVSDTPITTSLPCTSAKPYWTTNTSGCISSTPCDPSARCTTPLPRTSPSYWCSSKWYQSQAVLKPH
ncbi:hypothetical protein B0H13DRAFT_2667912, partial [Mycena leptocephala]